MITVDTLYYTDVYGGTAADDTEQCLKRAAGIIDSMILVTPVSDMQIAAYKNAVCAEAEYISENGGASAINSGGISSVSLGKFSVSSGSGGTDGIADKISDIAVMYLDRAGLLYRGLE